MGFFSALKELFNKNIECDADLKTHIMFFLKKKKYLYLNKNIIVREGTNCVVVYKSRVCDVILPGKYKINEQTIPETYGRAKIERKTRRGKKIRRIRVDLYFLSLGEFNNFEFSSDEPFYLKSKDLGRIKGCMRGSCTFRVLDPGRLIKCLIHDTGREKTEDFRNDVGLWIGNKINKKIEKNKIPIENIICNKDYVSSILNGEMEDALDNIGIFAKNINLKAIDFAKKYQKKINEYMSTHKAIIRTNNLWGNHMAMPNNQNNSYVSVSTTPLGSSQNMGAFTICKRCGAKNNITNSTCSNCGNRLL